MTKEEAWESKEVKRNDATAATHSLITGFSRNGRPAAFDHTTKLEVANSTTLRSNAGGCVALKKMHTRGHCME